MTSVIDDQIVMKGMLENSSLHIYPERSTDSYFDSSSDALVSPNTFAKWYERASYFDYSSTTEGPHLKKIVADVITQCSSSSVYNFLWKIKNRCWGDFFN